MKILCVLLVFAFLLCGCSRMPKQDPPKEQLDFSYAVVGQNGGGDGDVIYHSQSGAMVNGGVVDKTTDDEQKDTPIVTDDEQEDDSTLSGKWEYVDTMEELYVLTFQENGWVKLEQFFYDENGQPSPAFSMDCQPTIEDGRMEFPGDTEYDPPSLVLQLEHIEDVGNILSVVSSAGSFSNLTEYFHRVG